MIEDITCSPSRVTTFLAVTKVKPICYGLTEKTEKEKREIERRLIECLKNPTPIYLPGLDEPNEYRERLNQKIEDLKNLKKCNEQDQERKKLEHQLQELLQLKESFEQEYGNGRSL